SKHKFHPRPDSPLYFINEEPVLGYLKFSAKGTRREVFGMPIPNKLITADIQGEPYYKEYLEKVASIKDILPGIGSSLKSVYDAPRGSLSPVVIREPEFGKYQPLSEVQGKGKEKRTSIPTESFGHDESSSLYAELGLTDSEVESDKDVPGIDVRVQDEGHAGLNTGDAAASQPQLKTVVHAGPNLEHMDLEAMDVSTQPHPEQMD
nr:histone deacetylase 14 [Tanacetum cinerariifolium]